MRRIGGSDVPKLMGISPYGGPLEVYERIVLAVEAPWNPRMERGAVMEPVLRAIGQEHFGLELEAVENDTHDHPAWEFARAQVDDLARWLGLPVAVDYKSQSRWAKGWGADGSDEVPETIRAQLAWEMACTDRELGLLVVGFGEDVDGPEIFDLQSVVTYQVERDLYFESYLRTLAESFWCEHVLPGVPPKPTGKKRKS